MRKLLLASVVGCLLPGSAQASITFLTGDVTLSDGAYVSGSFTTNDAATSVTDFDITTSEGYFSSWLSSTPLRASAFNFNNYTAAATISQDGMTSVRFAAPGLFGRILNLEFVTPTNAGEYEVAGFEGTNLYYTRQIVRGIVFATQGVVSPTHPGDGGPVAGAVPEPATWAMMIGGFGLVGLTMRRRKAVATRVYFA